VTLLPLLRRAEWLGCAARPEADKTVPPSPPIWKPIAAISDQDAYWTEAYGSIQKTPAKVSVLPVARAEYPLYERACVPLCV
jgi:hypothetical protein